MKKILFPIIFFFGIVSILFILIPISKRDQPEPETIIPDNPQWHLPEGAKARINVKFNVMKTKYKITFAEYVNVVESVLFSADIKTLASRSYDNTILLWNIVSTVNTMNTKNSVNIRDNRF